VEQRILGKLYVCSTFGPFLKSIYKSKTAGAVLLKMMIQYLPLVLFIFDEEDKGQFYSGEINEYDANKSISSEDQEPEEGEANQENSKKGIFGGFLSRKKQNANEYEHPLQFFVKFIMKCLKVCDEKRKLEALLRIDLIMRKLSKKQLQEKVFIQLAGFLKAGNSPDVTLKVLNVLRRWISRFPCDSKKKLISKKLEEFLTNEKVGNIQVYEELFALWEAMEIEHTINTDISSQEYHEYVKVLEILLIQKRIGENLAEKVYQKWQKLLLLMKNKNNGIESTVDANNNKDSTIEPIMQMFVNYKLTDYEVGVLDGETKKEEPKKQPSQDLMNMDILGSDTKNSTNINATPSVNVQNPSNMGEINITFKKKEQTGNVDDLLDLTNFGDKMEPIESFSNKRSSKKKKKKRKNVLSGPGLKLRKKKSKKKKNEATDDLLDFSLPQSNNAPLTFDMDKLKNDLSIYEEHKKNNEDKLINSFFDSGNTKNSQQNSSDNAKIQKYFSKPNSENLDDFI
jgi:hypothetical protein